MESLAGQRGGGVSAEAGDREDSGSAACSHAERAFPVLDAGERPRARSS